MTETPGLVAILLSTAAVGLVTWGISAALSHALTNYRERDKPP